MSKYAEGTTVSVTDSQSEIATLLRRFGADGYHLGWEGNIALVGFKYQGRLVRFVVNLPDPADDEFWVTPSRGLRRTADQARKAHEAEERRRWRSVTLAIKAKLEAVATGIATFEDEFLAYTVLPDGSTVSQRIQPQIDEAYRTGVAPRLLQIEGPGGA